MITNCYKLVDGRSGTHVNAADRGVHVGANDKQNVKMSRTREVMGWNIRTAVQGKTGAYGCNRDVVSCLLNGIRWQVSQVHFS